MFQQGEVFIFLFTIPFCHERNLKATKIQVEAAEKLYSWYNNSPWKMLVKVLQIFLNYNLPAGIVMAAPGGS